MLLSRVGTACESECCVQYAHSYLMKALASANPERKATSVTWLLGFGFSSSLYFKISIVQVSPAILVLGTGHNSNK